MKTWIKYLLLSIALLLAGITFYFKVYVPKSTFETVNPKIAALNVEVFGIGNVDAKEIYPVGSQTGGKITAVFVDEGEWVKKGQLLATIDGVDLPILLQEAKASLQKVKYEAIAVKKELQSLQAQKDLIQITFGRYKKLYEQKYAAKAEYDKAKADLRSISAQISASKAHRDSSESEIQRVEKSIQAVEEKLSRLNIYSPIDGFVISKDVKVAQSVVPSQSIVKIVDAKTLWITAYVDEHLAAKIAINQKAVITLRSQAGVSFKGHVARISAISDKVTQEREIGVSFDTIPIPFYINEQAQVAITTKVVEGLFTFDVSLMRQEHGKDGVWIVKEARAHFVELDVVVHSHNLVGVKNGLTEETEIIIPNPKKKPFSEGMRLHQ